MSEENIYTIIAMVQLPKPMTGEEIFSAVQSAIELASNKSLSVYGENHPTDTNLAFFGQLSPHPNQQVAVQPCSDTYFSGNCEMLYESIVLKTYSWKTWCWREDEREEVKLKAIQDFRARLIRALNK